MKELRFEFKKYREKSGINQRDLAVKAKVQQCQISRYENGRQDITMATLVRLARAIGSNELMKLISKALVAQLG